MKDEKYTPEVGTWLKGREVAPRDSRDAARRTATRLPHIRQRSRWRPLPVFYRRNKTASTIDTREHQLTAIPATNGHIPTVIGRTQTMFSPAKAITAAALVFGLGGVLLIAQPFGQQADVAPGAESADFVEPVEFTAVLTPGPWVSYPTCEVIGGMSQCQGEAWTPDITEVSDSRLDGEMTLSANQNKWPGQPMLVMETYRITNEDGAWQGSFPSVYESFSTPSGAQSVVLVGEGAYEGLYAWMDVTDWSAIKGVVFSYPLPEAPAPPSAD
jgi:hypothetical protein